MKMRLIPFLIYCFFSGTAAFSDAVILQSTTSTQNSGLLDDILAKFKAASGIEVRVVGVGTGQALKNSANGDGDVVLVHARQLEDQFIADGWGVDRRDVMYNDFVIVGPPEDPAAVSGAQNASEAFARIRDAGQSFVSRGDGSGTHFKEMALWESGGIDPVPSSGTWYLETGTGMGATLNIAIESNAYTLTDRGTWISFGNKQTHALLFQGDPALFNPYGIMLVNPARHPHVNAEDGRALIDWLTSDAGQAAIAAYKVSGQQLFFPNAQ